MNSPYTKGFLGAMEAILVSKGVGAVRALLATHAPHTALEAAAIALIDKALKDLGSDGFEPARNLIEALANKQGKAAAVTATAALSLAEASDLLAAFQRGSVSDRRRLAQWAKRAQVLGQPAMDALIASLIATL